MKRLAYIPIAALLLSLSYVALSAGPADRPAGVAAENWVAVSDRLGIVLVESGAATRPLQMMDGSRSIPMQLIGPSGEALMEPAIAVQPSQALLLKPPVGGYFMVKGASGWNRLVVFEPIKGPGDAG